MYSPIHTHYYLTLIILNILFYLVAFSLLTGLLLLIKGRSIIFIDVFNQFSKCGKLRFVLLVSLFNLAGTPPTPLFIIKAANLLYVYQSPYSMLLIFLLVVNLLSITFYVQLIRFAYGNSSKLQLLVASGVPYLPKKTIVLIVSILVVSLFLVLSPYDILLPLSAISSY